MNKQNNAVRGCEFATNMPASNAPNTSSEVLFASVAISLIISLNSLWLIGFVLGRYCVYALQELKDYSFHQE